jgi:hypothetical protein
MQPSKQIDFHSPDRTGRDAEFASIAFLRIELHFCGLHIEGQSVRGAKRRTGAAVDAFVNVLIDAF